MQFKMLYNVNSFSLHIDLQSGLQIDLQYKLVDYSMLYSRL